MDDKPNPLAHLSPRAQKIAQQKVMTSFTDDQLMDRHGMTKREYNKLVRNSHFQEYMKQCQMQLHEEDFFKKLKAQEMYMRQAVFDELLSRFDQPDAGRDLPEGYTMEEKAAYMQRFAYFANFKDLMRIWDQVDKRTRLNIGEATEITEDRELVHTIQEKYTKIVTSRKRRQETIAEAKEVDAYEFLPNGERRQIEAEIVTDDGYSEDEDEMVMEEYLITKKTR